MGTTTWGAMQTFNLAHLLHSHDGDTAVIRLIPHITRDGFIDMIQEVDRYGNPEVCQIMKIVIVDHWMGRTSEEWDDMYHLEHLRHLKATGYLEARHRLKWIVFWGSVAMMVGIVWGLVADWVFKHV